MYLPISGGMALSRQEGLTPKLSQTWKCRFQKKYSKSLQYFKMGDRKVICCIKELSNLF
jgi:hypothetical protein